MIKDELWDERHLVFLSIIYQLLDSKGDPSELNPNIQDYIAGLCEEFNESSDQEREAFEKIYYYADTYFNAIYGKTETLH